MTDRRTFLLGLIAAPALIRTPGLLMPVRSFFEPPKSIPNVSLSDIDRVILPVIRDMMPDILASEILGIQPLYDKEMLRAFFDTDLSHTNADEMFNRIDTSPLVELRRSMRPPRALNEEPRARYA